MYELQLRADEPALQQRVQQEGAVRRAPQPRPAAPLDDAAEHRYKENIILTAKILKDALKIIGGICPFEERDRASKKKNLVLGND